MEPKYLNRNSQHWRLLAEAALASGHLVGASRCDTIADVLEWQASEAAYWASDFYGKPSTAITTYHGDN
jgi:hypothetical protein